MRRNDLSVTELRVLLMHYCFFDPSARTTRREMRARYAQWCSVAGREPVSPKMLGMTLRTLGVDGVSMLVGGRVVNGWRGAGFKEDVEWLRLPKEALVPYVEMDNSPSDPAEKSRRWRGPQK